MYYGIKDGRVVMGEDAHQVAHVVGCSTARLESENMSAIMLARKLNVTGFTLVQNNNVFDATVQEDPDECPGFCCR